MTVIQGKVVDIAGRPIEQEVRFRVPVIRGGANGNDTVTEEVHEYYPDPVTGELTTDSLDPGPARVTVLGTTYKIVIPNSIAPVPLWPLIDAHLDPPPSSATGFVKDGGGFARAEGLTQAQMDAKGGVYSPNTFYAITDSDTTI